MVDDTNVFKFNLLKLEKNSLNTLEYLARFRNQRIMMD